jgi:hypothetical protein
VGGIPGQAYRLTGVDDGNVKYNILQLQNIEVVLSVIYHVVVIRGLDENCSISKKKMLMKPSVWTKPYHQFLAILAVPVHSKPILEYDTSG